jgi:high affinity Mn2+ porin
MQIFSRGCRASRPTRCLVGAVITILALFSTNRVVAQTPATPDGQNETSVAATPPPTDAVLEPWAIHGQFTGVEQFHPGFHSAYSGPQSLAPSARGDETTTATLFAGVRLWSGAEAWVNPEVDQGFGLSNTFGVAGYTSGQAYKAGATLPYVRVQRLFLRQTIDLGGDLTKIDPDLNVLGGRTTADRIVFTIGKFSVVDIFDTNKYAHDSSNDFLNWSIIDMGAYDYAADGWGYSYGAAAEWYQDWWTLRTGVFDLSATPNYKYLDTKILFNQFHSVVEAEERHNVWGQEGKLKLLVFNDRARLGSLGDAIQYGIDNDVPADPAPVRKLRNKFGFGLNLEQAITDELGAFARFSNANGGTENYDFTDIDRSISGGLVLTGARWGRPNDTVGLAGVVNAISKEKVAYFNAGGLGGLIGDGKLTRYGLEKIAETFYGIGFFGGLLHLTADYQFVDNPGYNKDRGPVSILSTRLHVQF